MECFDFLPIDYLFTGSGSQPVTFAFSYAERLPILELQKSLEIISESFPLLHSTIHAVSDQEYAFRVNETRLLIEQAESSVSFAPQTLESFIKPVGSGPGEPAGRITLTDTPAGCVLAVSVSHALVDGFSYFHFLASWARQCRGDRFLAPQLERRPWAERWSTAATEVSPDSLQRNCGLFFEQEQRQTAPHALKEKRLLLSDLLLRELMQEARQGREKSFSENDVLTAWLWKSRLPVWENADQDSMTYLTCPFDFRRVYPGFAKTYFGCALAFATAELAIRDLSRALLGDVAQVVHDAVKKMQTNHIDDSMRTLDAFRRRYGVQGFERLHLRHPQRGLIVTNLTRLPIRDLDFGCGAPTAFATYMDFADSAAILPADNGVEILLAEL